ncbi:MAG: hypothetical protein V3U54_09890 [Thermodesulfobacteriota bacterium]
MKGILNYLLLITLFFSIHTSYSKDENLLEENTIPSGTALNQLPEYYSELKDYQGVVMANFLPLDKGNTWTYSVEKNNKKSEATNSVISVSDGWSIFDSYFTKNKLAFRIDPLGNILVSKDGEVFTFYNLDVDRSNQGSDLSTPAGVFKELLVITNNSNSQFWFKDIYAKYVGLIYHEHKSPKEEAKYTLIKAKVRGKDYPVK